VPRRPRLRPDLLGLASLAFALALLQRPGVATSDTKIDLHVDPERFLGAVTSLWAISGSLGHVQGGQYSGYLFPMGPFFAAGQWLGLAPWLVQRLWLGAVLAIAACGVAVLARALGGDRRPLLPLAAGAVALLNPYTVIIAGRTSITLLAFAGLPWLILAVHRGLRSPGRWWWPAAFALVLTAMGGGVNAAVIAFAALGPIAFALYEPAMGLARWPDARAFAWRTALCSALACGWWIAPLAAQALYGADFLRFTEQPGTIWTTTSASEALRLMGYWTSYIGVGYGGVLRPFQADAGVYLFSVPVLLATLLLPALAVLGLAWTRRWAYAPFALALVLGGVLVVMAGFPDGTPLRRGLTFAYNHVATVQILRTTFKAAPLVALGLALLAGAGLDALWRRAASAPRRAALAGGAAVLLALCAWPLVRGQAVDSQLSWRAIPAAWRQAGTGLDRTLAPNSRAVVLPGGLFAAYRWGMTYDAVLPTLTRRPVAVRSVVPYSDLRADDLLWTVDGLVQQQRLLPGQLPPLLRLLAAGAVVTGADGDRGRSGAVGDAEAARSVAAALGPASRRYGAVRAVRAQAGTLEPPARLPEVSRRDVDPGATGLVRVRPAGAPEIVDGSGAGIASLAATGGLDLDRTLLYAADRTPAQLRADARAGADLAITDSNRRRTLAASRARHGEGPTLAADDPIAADAAVLDPFPDAGTDAQTVAVRSGLASLRTPASSFRAQFPEHRPFAALDGDPRTAWLADPALDDGRDWLELGFGRRRAVDAVDLLPYADARGRTVAVEIAGRRYALRPGWNRLRLGLRGVDRLRVRIAGVQRPDTRGEVAGGIAELRVPGLRVTESLRPPVTLERALRGADLDRSALSYVFERTTGADPLRRQPATGTPQAYLARDVADGETQLDRAIAPPAARRYAADGWATVSPVAPDAALDRLAGTAGRARFDSSGRFEGRPDRRASRAFDGTTASAWIGAWLPRRPTWLSWSLPSPVTVRALRLRPLPGVRQATEVRLRAGGRAGPALAVGADGRVTLPAPVRARSFRLEIVAARFPAGTPARVRQRRAVGIAEIAGAGAAAPPRPAPRPVAAGCGALTVRAGAAALPLRVVAATPALERGGPLRVRSCGPSLALAAGAQRVTTASALLRPLVLRLRSDAPAGLPAAGGGGRVVDPGRFGASAVDGVRVQVAGPAWLVLAEGYDRGWRASCDGRDLGAPQHVDGYANGWPVRPGCRDVRFAFAPDVPVRWTMLLSGLACAALLALLMLRRRPLAAATPPPALDAAAADAPPGLPWRRTLAIAVPAALVLGFCFGARYTPVLGVVVAVALRHGIGARRLVLAAAALLGVAVPVAYLVFLPRDLGGFSFGYAGSQIVAHWAAVLALVALLLALVRLLRARVPAPSARGSSDRAAEPADLLPTA
jgi:arabinofuranan 3-O-arabinosyltransferase